jgi:hypothetical protein
MTSVRARAERNHFVLTALLRYCAQLDDDDDGLLTESNLLRWLSVLNHGDDPTPQDIEEVVENMDKCREVQGAPAVRVSPIQPSLLIPQAASRREPHKL